jgi:hypothetical protein
MVAVETAFFRTFFSLYGSPIKRGPFPLNSSSHKNENTALKEIISCWLHLDNRGSNAQCSKYEIFKKCNFLRNNQTNFKKVSGSYLRCKCSFASRQTAGTNSSVAAEVICSIEGLRLAEYMLK